MGVLFLTSGYWSPVHSSQLNPSIAASLGNDSSGRALSSFIPPLIPLLDRPWANFWSSSAREWFESFNVTKWEEDSLRIAIDQERLKEVEKSKAENVILSKKLDEKNKPTRTRTLSPGEDVLDALAKSWMSMVEVIKSPRYFVSLAWSHFAHTRRTTPSSESTQAETEGSSTDAAAAARSREEMASCWLPSCGRIDLRPYGVGMILDFGIPVHS